MRNKGKLKKTRGQLFEKVASLENKINKTWQERARLIELYLSIIKINVSLGVKYT